MPEPVINVVLAGGLGTSQMGYLRDRLSAHPQVRVTWAGDFNAYQRDLGNLGQNTKLQYNAILIHSFSAIPAMDAIKINPGLYDFAGFLDPVSDEAFVSSYPMPDVRPDFLWFRRTKPGIEWRLNITNAGEPELIDDWHNGIPKNPYVVQKVIDKIIALVSSSASTAPSTDVSAQSQGGT